MGALRARVVLALLTVAATPVAALAGDPDGHQSIWDWIVRFLQWAAGGWHHY